MNYYNEWDKNAAAWLRELIKAGLIPPGDVDERSITDVKPNELTKYTQCHFFAGIGGWSYALQLAGVGATQKRWTGSCPCQPFSGANNGEELGTEDERHLWPAFFRLIRECRPDIVYGEQVEGAIKHTDGSMEYRQTWKEKTTPLGIVYWAHTASARPAKDNAFTGWLTPTATERNHGTIKFHCNRAKIGKYEAQFRCGDQAVLEIGIPLVKSGVIAETDIEYRLNPEHSRWLMGFPKGWDCITATATPSILGSPPNSSSPPNPPDGMCLDE